MPEILDPTTVKPTPDKKSKEAPGPKRKFGSRTPHDGTCTRCGKKRRLNRLKLCYPCWVIWNIEDWAKKHGFTWKPGDPHPDWCQCDGLGEHKGGGGSARGFN